MASRSLFFPFLRARKQAQARIIYHTPSAQAILVVFAMLFILFLWMHFLLATEIESTGYQIKAQTEEVQKIERENAALRKQISETTSQKNMALRALELGYGPQPATYLRLPEPLAEPSSDATGKRPSRPATGGSSEAPTLQAWSFLNTVARTFDISPQTDTVP